MHRPKASGDVASLAVAFASETASAAFGLAGVGGVGRLCGRSLDGVGRLGVGGLGGVGCFSGRAAERSRVRQRGRVRSAGTRWEVHH